METTTNEVASHQARPSFRLKRSLLPIDEYAARQGLSRGIVERCGKLGIVRMRKYKGKTFVVDVPLGPYFYLATVLQGPSVEKKRQEPPNAINGVWETRQGENPIRDRAVRQGSPSESSSLEHPGSSVEHRETPDESVEPDEQTGVAQTRKNALWGPASEAGTMSALVKNMFSRAAQIMDEPAEKNDDQTDRLEGSSFGNASRNGVRRKTGFLKRPFSKAAKTIKKLIKTVGSKRAWQIASLFLLAFLFAALSTNIWLYMDRTVQLERLDQTYANIRKLSDDSIRAGQQVEVFRSELAESKAQIEHLKNELDNSRAQVQTVRNEFAQARGALEIIRKRNAQAVERLNKQIRKLTAQLPELTKNR